MVFIGSRNDQNSITDIPPTVSKSEKVTVKEAIYDLEAIGIGEHLYQYPLNKIQDNFSLRKIIC